MLEDNQQSLLIRIASLKHLIKVYRFLKIVGKDLPDPYFRITDRKIDHIKVLIRLVKHTFLNSLQKIANYSTIIWLAEGYDVKGIAIVGIRNDKALLHDIFVSKIYRRKGIGSKLMKGIGSKLIKTVIDFCRERKLHSLGLYVREDNIPAINLYRKYGFKVISSTNGNVYMQLNLTS